MPVPEIDWDNLPPTTMPAGVSLCATGFNDAGLARALGEAVLEAIGLFGSFMDLAKLDGVTLAVDYDAALAELDRGMEGLRPLSRSNSDEMQGVAMSPAVMRDGEVKTHLVFDAAMVLALGLPDSTSEAKAVAIGIIAHESAHVEINSHKEAAIPALRFGTPIEGYEHAVMFQVAEVCWEEYAACRISAPFAREQNAGHASTTIACLNVARTEANGAIRAYRHQGDIDRLVAEAGPPLCKPLKAAAYLLGGMDGDALGWEAFAEVRQAAEQSGYWEYIEQLHAILRGLWQSRPDWTPTISTFAPLEALAKQVFADGGLHFETDAAGACRIDVPFSLETMF